MLNEKNKNGFSCFSWRVTPYDAQESLLLNIILEIALDSAREILWDATIQTCVALPTALLSQLNNINIVQNNISKVNEQNAIIKFELSKSLNILYFLCLPV